MIWWTPFIDGVSHKACACSNAMKEKSWFEVRLDGTLFEGRIVGGVLKTSVRNVKTYEYISMDNIQLV